MSRSPIGAAFLLAGLAALAAFHGALPLPWQRATPPVDPVPQIRERLAAARPLTGEPALQLAPRFSRDGAYVAFALGDERESRIVVQAVDGSSRQFVGAAGALRLSPVFFPDGRRIAYWKSWGGDCAIVEYDLRTAAESPIVDCSMLPRVRFDLSPDGRSLVFTGAAQPEDAGALWVVDVADGTSRALTSPPAGAADDLHPRFSPDGHFVAFFRGRDRQRQPYAVPAGGGAARALTKRVGNAHGLAWLASGGPLLVASDWDGAPGLHLLDPATGAARALGVPAGRFPDASVSGHLAYEQDRRRDATPRNGLAEAARVVVTENSPAPVQLMLARAKR